jgi:hypothetical protein
VSVRGVWASSGGLRMMGKAEHEPQKWACLGDQGGRGGESGSDGKVRRGSPETSVGYEGRGDAVNRCVSTLSTWVASFPGAYEVGALTASPPAQPPAAAR